MTEFSFLGEFYIVILLALGVIPEQVCVENVPLLCDFNDKSS